MATILPNTGIQTLTSGENPGSWDVPINANWTALDALFDATTGHTHKGTAGTGPKILHADLDFGGAITNDHAAIDTHIADASIHFSAASVAVALQNAGTTVESAVKTINILNATSIANVGGGVVNVDVGTNQPNGTGPSNGVIRHYRSTHAPIAVSDTFTGDAGRPLSSGMWITQDGKTDLVFGDNEALLYIDRLRGDPAAGASLNRVRSVVPHSEVQRVSIEIPHIGVDAFPSTGVDVVTFQLALMASALPSTTAVSRLGFFLKIDLTKDVGGQIIMTRSINAQVSVSGSGPSTVATLWQDTGVVNLDSRHYRGVHEFSLDRNHAFHYYWNHGPVDIGTAGQAMAATNYVTTLRQSLLAEHTAFPQTTDPIYVAPEFGRFGFDFIWNVPEGGKVDAVVKGFTATSTDDETQYYQRVRATSSPLTVPPVHHPEACCTSGTHANVKVGDVLQVPARSDSPTTDPVPYVVVSRVRAGDATYKSDGFLLRPTSRAEDSKEPLDVAYCGTMAGVTLVRERDARPGSWGRFRLKGSNIPSLIDTPVFNPSDPNTPLTGGKPAGTGTHPQATPFPIPSNPGVGSTPAAIWPTATPVDSKVFKEVKVTWEKGDLIVDYLLADGLPAGASYDVTVTDRFSAANTVTIQQAVILSAADTNIRDVRIYVDDPTGGAVRFKRSDSITACSKAYVVIFTTGAPLKVTKTTNASDALSPWPGFPYPITDAVVADSFRLFEENTAGTSPAGVSIVSSSVRKGWYLQDPQDVFPPYDFTPVVEEGETIFLELKFDENSANKRFGFEISQAIDSSASSDSILFPRLAAATPVVNSIDVSPDTTVGTGKTVTVMGDCFTGVAIANVTNVSNISITSQNTTQIVFTCDLVANPAEVSITNSTGASVNAKWFVGAASSPMITTVNPPAVVEATKNVQFTVTGTGWDEGAYVKTTPDLPFLSHTVNAGAGTATVVLDVPDGLGGTNLAVAVHNPSAGVVSPATNVPVSSAAITVTSLAFTPASGGAGQGKETGQYGLMSITGTGFRAGVDVNTDKAHYFEIGNIVSATSTLLTVDYRIVDTAPAGEVIQVSVADLASGVSGATTFTVEERTPEITYVTFANPREGAGGAGSPANSAKVSINGRYFSSVPSANVTVTTGNGTPSSITVTDSLITIGQLAINNSTAGATLTIQLQTQPNNKVTTYDLTVGQHLVPQISGWTLKDAGGNVLDPKVIPQGATNYRLDVFGSNLAVATTTLTGPITGAPTYTETANSITITGINTVAALGGADADITLNLTPVGTTTTYRFLVAAIDATLTTGAVTVSALTGVNLTEGSKSATLTITGTNLFPNRVGSVALVPANAAILPLDLVQDSSGRSAVTVKIIEYDTAGTSITASADVADLTVLAGPYSLELRSPDGTLIGGISQTIPVAQNTARVGFDYGSLPAANTTASAAVSYTFNLLNAEGGETLEVIGGTGATTPATLSATTLQIDFTNPAIGNEVEVRLITVSGLVASIFRYTT